MRFSLSILKSACFIRLNYCSICKLKKKIALGYV